MVHVTQDHALHCARPKWRDDQLPYLNLALQFFWNVVVKYARNLGKIDGDFQISGH